jgi:2-polyprenyl-3-methyl-5-hydroxy-6-metoxy-1,4-benzoquinol methylase
MERVVLSERQRRELDYYNARSAALTSPELNVAAVDGTEKRPWNPYWAALDIVCAAKIGDTRLLDFGCGEGNYSVLLARSGFDVYGVDLSAGNLRKARECSARYGVTDRTHFQEGVVEKLPFPDGFFDVVVGIDILHHVEIIAAVRECIRVLRHGGLAVFKEPVRAPLYEPLRESAAALGVRPKTVSLERHCTQDERKLSQADLAAIKKICPSTEMHHFRLTSRLDVLRPASWVASGKHSRLEKLDEWLLRIPFLRPFAGVVVMVLRP